MRTALARSLLIVTILTPAAYLRFHQGCLPSIYPETFELLCPNMDSIVSLLLPYSTPILGCNMQ